MRICINKAPFFMEDRPVPVFSVYTVDRYKVIFLPEMVTKTVSGNIYKGIQCCALVDDFWRSAVLWQNDAIMFLVSGKAFMLCQESGTYEKVSEKLSRVRSKRWENKEDKERLENAVQALETAPQRRQVHAENFLRMGDSDRSLKAARVNNADAGAAIFAREETHWATGSKTGRPQVAHKIQKVQKDATAPTYEGKACSAKDLITVRLKFNGRTYEMILSPEEVAEWNQASTLEAKKKWLFTAHKAVVNESPEGVRALRVVKKADGTLDIIEAVQ